MKKFLALVTLISLTLHCGGSGGEKITDPNKNTDSQLAGNVSGTLSRADSPYHVMGNIVVDSGSNLTIEPGVELFFDDSTHFEINGGLSAIGGSFAPIIFTSFENNWRGLRVINSSQTIELHFTTIENVFIDESDTTDFGAIGVLASSVLIQNSIIRQNSTASGGGLSVIDARATIKNSIFTHNKALNFGGAILAINSSMDIINNTFFKNDCVNFGGGLVMIDVLTSNIQNNIFHQNTSQAGDSRIAIVSGDSANYSIQYNFMGFGILNPKFISDDDLHLQTVSPAIDKGNPSIEFNDVDGSRNDQGAYGGPLGNF